jgi:COMPASS component SWD3
MAWGNPDRDADDSKAAGGRRQQPRQTPRRGAGTAAAAAALNATDLATPADVVAATPPTEPSGRVAGPLRFAGTLPRAHDGAAVSVVAFSPVIGGGGAPALPMLATAGAVGTIRLWQLGGGEGGTLPLVLPGSGSNGGKGSKTTTAAAKPAAELWGHATGVNDLAWSPSGRYLASAGDDGTVRLWEVRVVVAPAAGAAAAAAAATPPTPTITATCAAVLRGHTHHVLCVAFHPAGNMLASAAYDETVRVWDSRSLRCLRLLPAHADPVTGLEFSRDGTLLASCSYDGLARLWHPATGRCLRTLPGGGQGGAASVAPPVSGVALSPNGRYVLQASLDGALRLVDSRTGRVAKTYRGHVARDYCCGGIGFLELGTGGVGGGGGGGAGGEEAAAVVAGSEDGGWAMWGVNSRRLLQRVVGTAAGAAAAAGADKEAGKAAGAKGGGNNNSSGRRRAEEGPGGGGQAEEAAARDEGGHRAPVFCVDWRRGGLGRPGEGDESVALCTAGGDGDVRFWVGVV